jgi:hypothetical protein
MATGRLLKNLLLMSALACATLAAAPALAHDVGRGPHREYHRGWGPPAPYWHAHQRWHHPNRHHYKPRYHAPRHHHYRHRHYRGCGHVGYHNGALIGFLVDYARNG